MTLLQLYLTFVRPHFEYAAPVWDPHQQGLSDSLERVQNFALRMGMRDWKADYTMLLQFSNLPTLATRRRYLKLCFLYQVIQGQFDFHGAPVVMRNLPLNFLFFLTLLTYEFPPPFQYIVVILWNLLNVLLILQINLSLFYLGYNYQLVSCYYCILASCRIVYKRKKHQ